jgi:TonB family protein
MKTKRLPLFALPLLLIITSAQAQTPPSWKLYTIPGEDFSVALPNLPAFHTTYQWDWGSQKGRRVYSLGAYADGLVYVVYVYENPDRRQSLDSFLKKAEIPKSSLTDLALDGFTGKERRLPEFETMSQFFATKDRIYYFMAMGTKVDDPRMTKFFSSLSLRRLKDSIEVVDGPGLPWELPAEPETVHDETTKNLYEKLYIGRDVDRKARLAMKPEPSYTETARQHGVTGTVVLKCVFARDGRVTNIRIASGLPDGLTEQAINATRKIKFVPAIKDGKFVSMWMQLEYNFNLY